ncbi:MAG TPA: tail fiber domain-containing protein, partial [Thermoanaerobaculia bacterium]|nr:tail fiber domain-containing protein [Thermoanaerobaculia bacterium]
ASDRLYELRPVSFRYKKYVKEAVAKGEDPSKLPRSYGLIAEEVTKVFPDLVVYGKDGKPKTIKYRLLAPLLLNELQKEHWRVISDETELATLKKRESELVEQAAEGDHRLSTVESELAAQRRELMRLQDRIAGLASLPQTGAGGAAAGRRSP